jgi:hypothetical protein
MKTSFVGAMLLTVALFSQTAAMQAPAQSSLTGTVTSSEEGRMEGVLVSAKRQSSNKVITVVSNGEGVYSFPRGLTKNVMMFVDYKKGATNSGVALVNPSSATITISAQLRSQTGDLAGSASIQLNPGQHTAAYVDGLLSAISSPFAGTLSLSSASGFAAVNLSAGVNAHGESIFSALPVTDLDHPTAGTSSIFPQLIDGGGLTTQVLLMNPSATTAASGTLEQLGLKLEQVKDQEEVLVIDHIERPSEN